MVNTFSNSSDRKANHGSAKLPMFLGIGAQRSGSTWLHENLKPHPEIWLPPTKEIHYFNDLRDGPFFCERYRSKFRIRAGLTKNSILKGEWSFADFKWDLKYLLMPRSDKWYTSLFSQGKHLVAGEITPAYSTLSEDVVASIKKINPEMKIIFLMRDPIDRSWSHARKDLPGVYGKPVEEIPTDTVLKWFNEPYCALRTDYVRTLEIWQSYFPKEQMFIGFLDEIKLDPENFLLRIYDFLGVEKSTKYLPKTLHAVVNARKKTDMAPEYEYELAKIHEPKLAKLKQMFNTYPAEWHARCVSILNR